MPDYIEAEHTSRLSKQKLLGVQLGDYLYCYCHNSFAFDTISNEMMFLYLYGLCIEIMH
jgi:hypothetical protein